MPTDNGNGPTARKPDPQVVIPTVKVAPLPFSGKPPLPGLPPQKTQAFVIDPPTIDPALVQSLPPSAPPQPAPPPAAADAPPLASGMPGALEDLNGPADDAGATQQMRVPSRLRRGAKIALVAVGLIASVALVYAIVTLATGGTGTKTETAKGAPAMPTTAPTPTGSPAEIATQALELANRQAATYNAFTAKLGTDLGAMDDRITALEKKLEAKDAEIARLRQTVTALEQSAGKVEAEPAIEIDGERPAAKPQGPTTGTDDLVIPPDKRPNEVDPTTLYPSE